MKEGKDKILFLKKNLRLISETPGVYIFYDKDKTPIYIGKSNNLRRRIQSYLLSNLSEKTEVMVSEVRFFSVICVLSEIESLLLEACLVRQNKPKFNIQLKDDKQPLYIKITKDEYPRITTARKKEVESRGLYYFGPFPSSSKVHAVLKMLRRIFPYAHHKIGKRACLYSQMGLCNPCPSNIEKTKNKKKKAELKKIYMKNIRLINWVLSGRFNQVNKILNKMMKDYANKQKYEMAKVTHDQIEKLDYITQPVTSINHFLENPNLREDVRNEELKSLIALIRDNVDVANGIRRMECYDVAHLAGSSPTASMVTFIDGEPDKHLYRHFRIKQKKTKSDTDSLREVIKRRSKHFNSWGIPDLIVVDGGKPQVSVFVEELSENNIPVIGVAKRNERLVIPVFEKGKFCKRYITVLTPEGPARNLIQRIRNEAHRFARRYHHKLVKKELLCESK